jgi:elongation factor G
MASYSTKDIRNVAFAGHSDAGKTTLAEALLFAAGATKRQGTVQDGTTVGDYDVEEKERGHSIDTAILHLDRNGRRLNLLDTPGRPDFIGQTLEALNAVETVALVVNAASGLGVNTRRVWLEAERMGLGRVVVVNKMDHENIDVDGLLADLKKSFGDRLIPANLPLGHGPDFKGVVPTLTLPADVPDEVADRAAEVHESFMEAVIEADDQLLERYLGGEEISADELAAGVAVAVREGTVVPVLYASAEKNIGVAELLDFLAGALPSPEGKIGREVLTGAEGDETMEKSSDSAFCAQVFKIMTDDYVGKISFLRAFSGELAAESSVLNPQTGKAEKVKEVFLMQGWRATSAPSRRSSRWSSGTPSARTRTSAASRGRRSQSPWSRSPSCRRAEATRGRSGARSAG